MAKEYELYFTVAEFIPYVKYVAKAVKILDQIYNFGKKSAEEQAIEVLVQQVAVLEADIADINRRVDELNRRVVQNENLARWREIQRYLTILGTLSKRLERSPDVDDLAEIANAAALHIAAMLADTDLWLWSDIGQDTAPNGKPVVELADPEFKVLPLPVFAAMVSLFALGSSMHIGLEPTAHQDYAETFAKFRTAVGVRNNWVELQMPAETLPEKIRSVITVVPFPLTTHAVEGECVYGLVCFNRIDRTTTNLRDVTIAPRDATPTTLCTAPSNLGQHDEAIIEDDYGPIIILGRLEDMLDRLATRGSLVDPFVGEFPNVFHHALFLYAVEPGGQLVRFDCKAATTLVDEVEWQSSLTSLGTGWDVKAILPGHWNILYAVQADGSVVWNRHDGALTNTLSWSSRVVEPPRFGSGFREGYIAGSSGTIYRSLRGTIQTGDGVRLVSELTADRHPGVEDGTGEFTGQTTIHRNWPQYTTAFGDSEGVIYGIDGNGDLFWHKHEDTPAGPVVLGPAHIGTGWNIFSRTFSAGHGFIFGVFPSGKMVAYHFDDWRSGPMGAPPRWKGPTSVRGGGWNAFAHLVPILQQPRPIVH